MNEPIKSALDKLIFEMDQSDKEQVLEVVSELKKFYCEGCGRKQDSTTRYAGGMSCQCQNDE